MLAFEACTRSLVKHLLLNSGPKCGKTLYQVVLHATVNDIALQSLLQI